METRTQLVIALTSIITSAFTVFLSNFLAPRINAWYEKKYRNSLVLKKTLRILLEIETYVQRNLKLPSLQYISDALLPKLKEMGYVDNEQELAAALPKFLQYIQPTIVQHLPDKSEALDHEFSLVLSELATVDPLLAYRISERHSIAPIQRMESNLIESLEALGIVVKDEDQEIQALRQLMQAQKDTLIDEQLADLRQDILNVAAKIGKKDLSNIESYFSELDIKRRKEAQRLAGEIVKYAPIKNKDGTSKSNPTPSSATQI